MTVLVHVADKGCSLRRRHIALRAERHLVLNRVPATVREFDSAKALADSLPSFETAQIHAVFVHAGESDSPDWREIVFELFHRLNSGAAARVLLVTYSGAGYPTSFYDVGEYAPGRTSWWKHCAHVSSRSDYPDSPQDAAAVGSIPNKPPVERWLDEVLGIPPSHPSLTNATSAETPLDETGPSARDAASSEVGLRHVVLNAIGPIREAAEYALFSGSGVAQAQQLWSRLTAGLAACRSQLPDWVGETIAHCEQTLLPKISEGQADANALATLVRQLVPIESYALGQDRRRSIWSTISEVLPMKPDGPPLRVLWIEDQEEWFQALNPALAAFGVNAVYSRAPTPELFKPEQLSQFDAVVVDLILEGEGKAVQALVDQHHLTTAEPIDDSNAGIGIIQVIQSLPHPPPTFVLSALESASVIRACIVYGAEDYFVKGRGEFLRLLTKLRRNAEAQRQRRIDSLRPANPNLVIGDDADPVTEVIGLLDHIAASAGSRGPVFLFGEPGVGKEELARELYARSSRRRANFRKVNCANFVGDLMESEIYGHMKGAFTGASANKNGIVEDVKGGVLFIDEVDKLAIDQQNRLLQFLETGTYRKLGSNRDEKIDVLTVLASNEDPRSAGDGRASAPFISRLKFLFRIAPLRERMSAVDGIARALCTRISRNLKYEERVLAPDALKWLREQVAAGKFDGQGGNIRGLANLIETTIIYNSKRREIGRAELVAAAKSEAPRARVAADAVFHSAARTVADGLLPAGHADMDRVLDNFKAEFLREIIFRLGGRAEAAAFVYKKPDEPQKKKQEAFRQHIHGLRQKGLWPWDV